MPSARRGDCSGHPLSTRRAHGATTTSYQRILTSTTQDFVSFSEPSVAIDLGYSVVDATFFAHEGRRFRLTVRHQDRTTPTFVSLEVGSSLVDRDFQMVTLDIGKGMLAQGEGPAPAVDANGTVRLLVDEFAGSGYHVFETTDPLRGPWRTVPDAALPIGARHGSLLALSAVESQQVHCRGRLRRGEAW